MIKKPIRYATSIVCNSLSSLNTFLYFIHRGVCVVAEWTLFNATECIYSLWITCTDDKRISVVAAQS